LKRMPIKAAPWPAACAGYREAFRQTGGDEQEFQGVDGEGAEKVGWMN